MFTHKDLSVLSWQHLGWSETLSFHYRDPSVYQCCM